MTTAKPPCDIGWTAVGQNCQILFADTLFFHYRINATGNTFRYGIGRPIKVGNTVIHLLYDRTINFDVGGRFHNSKETLSMPVMTFCSILILPLFSSCARSWSNFCRFITYPLNSASSSYVLVVFTPPFPTINIWSDIRKQYKRNTLESIDNAAKIISFFDISHICEIIF